MVFQAKETQTLLNHQVVISGEYYDPSYGIKHGSLTDIDDNAIDGYYFIFPPIPIDESNLNIDFNGDGDKTDYYNGWPVDEPTVNLDVNGDGDKLDTNLGYPGAVYLFMKNPSGLDLIEQRFDF